ncbi:MAG: hypothetical protein M3345_05875 [Actinomycetota bacterium]|nr:hypothetical protein [Actinomycetota bacterium]
MADRRRVYPRITLRVICGIGALGILLAGLAVTPAGAVDNGRNGRARECEAKDRNRDGEIGPGETQDCGGEVYGEGGNDGANLPPAEDAGSHQWVDDGYALHWSKPSGDERKIIIRDSVANDNSYNTKLGNVIPDWGASSKFKFVRQSAETDSTTRLNCPMPTNYGRVRVCNHSDYTFSYAGLANVRYNDQGHIQRGRVRVKNGVSESAKRPLLCQEVGHTLGLGHRPGTTGSCMHQNASVAASSPDRHDYDQLVNQTHSHGGESDTGGSLSELDTGGGLLDGCGSFLCFDGGSHGHAGGWHTEIVSVKHLDNGDTVVNIGFTFVPAWSTYFLIDLI